MASTPQPLDQLLQSPLLWRARSSQPVRQAFATGFPGLDTALHDGGWPLGATTELLTRSLPWPLLMPALQRQMAGRGSLLLVAPPWLPSAAFWAASGVNPERIIVVHSGRPADNLWAAEQALMAGSCALVCQWLPVQGSQGRVLRQLQLAAAQGGSWHVLVRPPQVAQQPSPAALRMQLAIQADGLWALLLLKQRGGWAGQRLSLDLYPQLARLSHMPPAQWPIHLAEPPVLRHRTAPLRPAVATRLARVHG